MLFKKIVGASIRLNKPFVVLLHGDMGAGKTTFVQKVLKNIKTREGRINPMAVTSPTFTIINQYAPNVFHADLYRIKNEGELHNTDFFEILNGNNVFFIEWPYNNVSKSVYKNIRFGVNVNITVGKNGKRKFAFN
jgi:tRNA threonylcarbamoyladenosine biosynthesis protein TsaE